LACNLDCHAAPSPAGTCAIAETTETAIVGALVNDTDDFSDVFLVRDDDGIVLSVRGWLCTVTVDVEPAYEEPVLVGGTYMSHADYVAELARPWHHEPHE
jgi:hypothetical protein